LRARAPAHRWSVRRRLGRCQQKKKWAVVIQGLLAAQAFLLAALVAFDALGAGAIIAMSLLMGVLSSFDMPLRQSLIASFVENRDALILLSPVFRRFAVGRDLLFC
jgi:hypothetical protein